MDLQLIDFSVNVYRYVILYKFLVWSHLEFASVIWNRYCVCVNNQIQYIQKSFVSELTFKLPFLWDITNPARAAISECKNTRKMQTRRISFHNFLHGYNIVRIVVSSCESLCTLWGYTITLLLQLDVLFCQLHTALILLTTLYINWIFLTIEKF